MINIIISKESYTKPDTGKEYLSAVLGDGTSVPTSEELYARLNVGDKVLISSRKLKMKTGAFFTLRSITLLSDLA